MELQEFTTNFNSFDSICLDHMVDLTNNRVVCNLSFHFDDEYTPHQEKCGLLKFSVEVFLGYFVFLR